jgi:hypothetical protein
LRRAILDLVAENKWQHKHGAVEFFRSLPGKRFAVRFTLLPRAFGSFKAWLLKVLRSAAIRTVTTAIPVRNGCYLAIACKELPHDASAIFGGRPPRRTPTVTATFRRNALQL